MDVQEARTKLALVLRDFEMPTTAPDLYQGFAREPIGEDQFPAPDLLYLGLVLLAEYPWTGYEEKVRWTVYFIYQGTTFALQSAKFGHRLCYPNSATTEQCNSLKGKLSSVAKIAERYFASFAEIQVNKGNITIANNFSYMTFAYRHLRDLAEHRYVGPVEGGSSQDTIEKTLNNSFSTIHRWKEASVLAGAMIDSYFSRLEHFLVLCPPFLGIEVENGVLRELVGATWSEKYSTVFDLQRDLDAKLHYDRLVNIKERIRNVLAHGGFEKQDGSFFFHVPKYGAVPVQMSRVKDTLKFNVFAAPIPKDVFQRVCDEFDAVDDFLSKARTSMAWRWAESGLDVSFDNETAARYVKAASTWESFEEFIEHQSHLADRAVNMDW